MSISRRIRLWRLFNVWGEHMPETPEVLAADPLEEAEPMPPATAVRCPTCHAERGQYCRTLTADLDMRICHMARATAFVRAEKHRSDLSDALKRGV